MLFSKGRVLSSQVKLVSMVQEIEHPSPSIWLPSSHCYKDYKILFAQKGSVVGNGDGGTGVVLF